MTLRIAPMAFKNMIAGLIPGTSFNLQARLSSPVAYQEPETDVTIVDIGTTDQFSYRNSFFVSRDGHNFFQLRGEFIGPAQDISDGIDLEAPVDIQLDAAGIAPFIVKMPGFDGVEIYTPDKELVSTLNPVGPEQANEIFATGVFHLLHASYLMKP